MLDENADGSTNRIELGTISDNIETTLPVTYRLAAPADSNNNNQFQIDGGKLYYTGTNSGNFEAGDKLIAEIIRTLDDNTATDQTLQYTINLKNLNDNAPAIKGYLADDTIEIPYIAAGTVGGGDGRYLMAFEVDEAGDTLTIDFVKASGTNEFQYIVGVEAQYMTDGDPTSKLTGFKIAVGLVGFTNLGLVLTGEGSGRDSSSDFNVWDEHLKSVTYLGSSTLAPSISSPIFTNDVTLTGTKKGIVVEDGTEGTIANFASIDPDGDLNSFEYSVTDSDGGTDGDSTYFMIDEDTGELRFNPDNVPTFNTGTNADNIYDITVTVSDSTFSDTYDLQIVVVP